MLPPHILDAVRRGWKVFPIARGTKSDCLTRWVHGGRGEEASSDIEQITLWANRWSDCNWGLATGNRSGVFAVDSDSPLGWKWAKDKGLTNSRCVKSGSVKKEKAFHFIFKQPEDVRVKNSQSEIADGIDIRGDGGFVVMPGSLHPEGNFYTLIDDCDPIDAPEWLLELIKKTDDHDDSVVYDFEPLSEDQIRHGVSAFKAACAKFQDIPADEGQRNGAFNKLAFFAGKLVARGYFDRDLAEQLGFTAGAEYLAKDRQHKNTWNSGFEAGLFRPLELDEDKPEDVFGKSPMVSQKDTSGASTWSGLTTMSDVVLKPIRWLWPGWLPAGKLVIYAGPGGVGKSTVTFSWAAAISKGGNWPDGVKCKQGRVLIWSGEDDAADTIGPRLKAMNADMSRIQVINQPFDPARDFGQLKSQFKAGDVDLFIIDPIVSAIRGDINKTNEVRRDLQQIVDFAAEIDCCVVGISHFNKGSAGKNPTERVTGSQGITALARMTIVGQKDEDTQQCVIARSKSNISVDTGGLGYRIEPLSIQGGIETTRISWTGAVEGAARDILSDLEPSDEKVNSHKVEQAKLWLEIALSQDPKPASRLVSESGFSLATLKRAKKLLAIRSTKDGSEWLWSMPFDPMPA